MFHALCIEHLQRDCLMFFTKLLNSGKKIVLVFLDKNFFWLKSSPP